MAPLEVRAFGKINLALYVLGRRPDGYHDIGTLMQAVDTCDRLTFEVSATATSLTCDAPDLPIDESNLIVRAVRLLEQESGRSLPLNIRLEKVIPVGAGMGGGSSDAAATLWAVNRLHQLGLDIPRLRQLAARLGSDVPFFLTAGQALAEGRGERLTEVDLPADYDILMAFPNLLLTAAEGYRRAEMSLTNPLAECRFQRYSALEDFWSWIGSLSNDLAAGVTATYPVVARGIEAMRSLGARYAGMTGSGSAVFGLFSEPVTPREVEGWPLSGAWRIWKARPLKTSGSLLPAAGSVSPGG